MTFYLGHLAGGRRKPTVALFPKEITAKNIGNKLVKSY